VAAPIAEKGITVLTVSADLSTAEGIQRVIDQIF